MAQAAVYTASQEAHAQVLLERAKCWTRGTRKRDGLAFVIFPSSRKDKDGRPMGYYTTERGCTCPSFLYRGACSHVLAVQIEAERAREAVAVKPVRSRYDALMDNQLVDAF